MHLFVTKKKIGFLLMEASTFLIFHPKFFNFFIWLTSSSYYYNRLLLRIVFYCVFVQNSYTKERLIFFESLINRRFKYI